MKSKRGFGIIGILILCVVIAIITLAGYKVLAKRVKHTEKNGSQAAQTSKNGDLPSCTFHGYTAEAPLSDATNAVKNGPTDIKYLKYLLNHTSDDKRFIYMVMNTDKEIPVYAPADGRLVYVINKHADNWDIAGGRPSDYDMAFTIDCKSFWRINHVVNPIDEIKEAEPNPEVVELEAGKGLKDEWSMPTKAVYVKAGQQIGTTAVPSYTQWDVGYFKDGKSVCIFNELTEGKQQWLDMMSPVSGMNAGPVPGTVCESNYEAL